MEIKDSLTSDQQASKLLNLTWIEVDIFLDRGNVDAKQTVPVFVIFNMQIFQFVRISSRGDENLVAYYETADVAFTTDDELRPLAVQVDPTLGGNGSDIRYRKH